MKSSRGFTTIEVLIVAAILAAASIIFFIQKDNITTAARDDARRTSINALYYSLEEVYAKKNNGYPRSLSSETLPSVDPELFKDPDGVMIGEGASSFRYDPTDCEANLCKGYTLRASLEQEDDYVKTNRTK